MLSSSAKDEENYKSSCRSVHIVENSPNGTRYRKVWARLFDCVSNIVVPKETEQHEGYFKATITMINFERMSYVSWV